MLCRVALQYFVEQEEQGRDGPADLEDKVYAILEKLWAKRVSKQGKAAGAGPAARGRKRKRQKTAPAFPELLAPTFDEDAY